MQKCDVCGKYAESDAIWDVLVNVKKQDQASLNFCWGCYLNIWDNSYPSDWVKIGETLYQKVYWECDFCGSVVQWKGINVYVRPDQPKPQFEYVVCNRCFEAHEEKGSMKLTKQQAEDVHSGTRKEKSPTS
jgi:hypothetical protein